jgi:hypothetical protein
MTATRVLRLEVPREFTLGPFYETATPEQLALALKLGGEAVSFLQKRGTDALRQETHEEAVKEVTEEYEAQLGAQKARLLRTEEQLRASQMRVEALEASASEIRRDALRQAEAATAAIVEAKNAHIAQLQSSLELQMGQATTMAASLDGLKNSITKTFSSSKEKGSLGEALMENFLKKAYDCDVAIVSKGSETADIRMTRRSAAGQEQPYLWEVKNYTRMVSTEEVEKFRRDLRLHPEIKCGFMVSLRTGIVGRSRGGDVDTEFLEDGRPIIYLSNFMNREDPVFTLQGFRPFFETLEAISRPVKDEAQTIRALEAKSAVITSLLRSHEQAMVKQKNVLVGHRKRNEQMFAELSAMILEQEAQIRTLLRVALGGEEETEEVQQETDTALSAFVFKRESVSQCSEDRMREFVKWLLTEVEVREGTQIELKDLVDRAKVAGYPEKYVRGLREELFQESAWPKGSRWLLGMRWREKLEARPTLLVGTVPGPLLVV